MLAHCGGAAGMGRLCGRATAIVSPPGVEARVPGGGRIRAGHDQGACQRRSGQGEGVGQAARASAYLCGDTGRHPKGQGWRAGHPRHRSRPRPGCRHGSSRGVRLDSARLPSDGHQRATRRATMALLALIFLCQSFDAQSHRSRQCRSPILGSRGGVKTERGYG